MALGFTAQCRPPAKDSHPGLVKVLLRLFFGHTSIRRSTWLTPPWRLDSSPESCANLPEIWLFSHEKPGFPRHLRQFLNSFLLNKIHEVATLFARKVRRLGNIIHSGAVARFIYSWLLIFSSRLVRWFLLLLRAHITIDLLVYALQFLSMSMQINSIIYGMIKVKEAKYFSLGNSEKYKVSNSC